MKFSSKHLVWFFAALQIALIILETLLSKSSIADCLLCFCFGMLVVFALLLGHKTLRDATFYEFKTENLTEKQKSALDTVSAFGFLLILSLLNIISLFKAI